MANRSNSKTKSTPSWTPFIVLSLFASILSISLYSYDASDPSINSISQEWGEPSNLLGYMGSWTADIFLQAFGYTAWAWPIAIFSALGRWLFNRELSSKFLGARLWISLLVVLCAGGLFNCLFEIETPSSPFPAPGLLGIALYELSAPWIGHIGVGLSAVGLVWVAFMIWWPSLPSLALEYLAISGEWFVRTLKGAGMSYLEARQSRKEAKLNEPKLHIETSPKIEDVVEEKVPPPRQESLFIPAIKQKVEDKNAASKNTKRTTVIPTSWHLPPLSLLEKPLKVKKDLNKDSLLNTAKKISQALKSFDVEGEITEISPGPIITLYEFQPAPGIRVQKIVSVSTDLAMALGVTSVRIVAPIPGKSVAGIEVPNEHKENITLRDVYEATMAKAQSQKLPLVLGRDGEGRPVCEDLSRMPHLLIGGATNMGKSVLVNSILTSLLLRFSPDQLRLIIVDPKLVEFKIYEDIPHLMLPIVNDPMDASQALKWAVNETKRRYLEMQKFSARNLESYNSKVEELEVGSEEERPELLSNIVIIVDELAELMLTAKKDVEQSIVRLSQLARAAGIHLIMATQRPSADVVTGLIKSNCPSRASLRVASATDSRIILDTSGAEQLLGKGDMFFTNSGPMGLRRMQGCFVGDDEVERICNFWRDQGQPEYHDEILEDQNLEEIESASGKHDPLFKDVVSYAKEKGTLSTSLIQRRFQIGYTRAARIMEQLEEAGIVGEAAAAGKPRDVLI